MALRRREQNAIDTWDGRTYRRALLVDGLSPGSGGDAGRTPRARRGFTSSWQGATCRVPPRLPHARRWRVCSDIDLDLSGFYARAARDPVLNELAERYRGLKPPRFPTVFECLLNAVACQQLSIAAGLTILSRLAAAAGAPIGPLHVFPTPSDVLRLPPSALRTLGFSERKAETILELARAAAAGELELKTLEQLDDAAVIEALVRHPGIGRVERRLRPLRGLGRLHVFPQSDVGALNGLRSFLAASGRKESPHEALVGWAPDAGLVYFHLLLRGLEQAS